MKNLIKLLLVDDHPVVRRGISACLAHEHQVAVVGEAENGLEALRKARELVPDVVLMDIEMPHMNGLVVTETLKKELPQIKVLILSMHNQSDYVHRILDSGARGYVLKNATLEELIRAIEAVHNGETYFSPEVTRFALHRFVKHTGGLKSPESLTNREREVLILIAEGLANKEIAGQLGIGVRTVETHRERIMRKLHIPNAAGLTRFAVSQGLISVQQRHHSK